MLGHVLAIQLQGQVTGIADREFVTDETVHVPLR